MDEYVDEKAQKWKDLKLKWSTPSPIKSTLQEKPKSSLNEKQIESESLSDIVNSLQKIPSPKQWGLMISPDHSISSEHFNQN